MVSTTSFPSLEALGDRLQREVERQLGTFVRIVGAEDGIVATPTAAWISTGEEHPFANLGVIDPEDDTGVRAMIKALSDTGRPSAIAVLGAASAAVAATLKDAGYQVAEEETPMALDLATLQVPPAPDGIEIIEIDVEREEDVSGWNLAMEHGYEIPPRISAVFGPAADHINAGVRYFGARRKDGLIVSTSAVLLDEEIAGIYGVATLPEERRKGLAAVVTAAGLQAAADAGYRVGALQSSPAGVNVYAGLGMKALSQFNIYAKI